MYICKNDLAMKISMKLTTVFEPDEDSGFALPNSKPQPLCAINKYYLIIRGLF